MSERSPSDAGSAKVPSIPPPAPSSRSAPPPPPPPKPRPVGTILGVAPPKLPSDAGPVERSPVFVRSESIADDDLSPPAPAPSPVVADEEPTGVDLPLSSMEPPTERTVEAPHPGTLKAAISTPVRVAGIDLPLWSLLGPVLLLLVVVVAVAAVLIGSASEESPSSSAASAAPASAKAAASVAPAPKVPPKPALAKMLEGKAPESLSVNELLALDDERAERDRDAAKALRERIANEPEALKDKAVLKDLRKYVDNDETAREALAAMAKAPGSLGPDLLYEIWTGTQARTDTTELARALLHTRDVRSKASPALEVALALRQAETCEKNKEILPRALKEGDKRTLHLLTKLERKQGCGPKKKDDCYACLRAGEDLKSTINAVKARKAPTPFNP